ncbi:Homoserine dehydrogenase [Planctopirus ephydatiae]|uniref:Homoserine dehydrogenase n=1 Tax=Planctopirus ephydatiae TaxID=2528019 RepID=A0A518GSR9_9PLAN|nr:homoserine dehydrogenase [Planctopirus ephydatiae]QDV31631.1 Homoserine dehydrogenase [Planctopirus ephydatiae]
MAVAPLKVGIVGLGNVGTGVARILTDHPHRIAERAGRPIVLKRAVVRNLNKPRDIRLESGVLTNDIQAVINDPEITVAMELMGGIHPAREVILALLKAGKDVVTANKALLCEHGNEIFHAAREYGRTVCFEAAVAGGIPIIAAVGQSMAANQIIAIQAILNGTSNYILTEMQANHQHYHTALKQAQDLGYAESDPTLDVNGLDAAQKLGILCQLAFGTRVTTSQFEIQGIDSLDLSDLKCASDLGYHIKLLAQARLTNRELEMSVRPTLIRKDTPLSQISGPFNAVLLEGDMVGKMWYSGRGAGQAPTASACAADLIDLAVGRAQLTFERLDLWRERPEYPVMPADQTTSRYFLRLRVEDKPNVMAEVTGILGAKGISLASIVQPEAPEVDAKSNTPVVPLVIMTHRTTAGQLQEAMSELDLSSSVRGPRICLAVAD